jgi:hypothetical protein
MSSCRVVTPAACSSRSHKKAEAPGEKGEELGLGVAGPVSAQHGVPLKTQTQKLQSASSNPCCGITAIDGVAGTATAVDKATGQTFTFTVPDQGTLQGLQVGQAVFADRTP